MRFYTTEVLSRHLPVELQDTWFWAHELIEDAPSDAYGVLLYYLIERRKPTGEERKRFISMNSFCREIIDFLPEWDGAYYDNINNMLHCLHQSDPWVREDGVRVYYEALGKSAVHVNLNSMYNGKLFAGGDFPADLKDQIEEVLAPWRDDLVVNYLVTWYYCHLDQGDAYVGGQEFPYLLMGAVCEESLNFALKALEKTGILLGAYESSGEVFR